MFRNEFDVMYEVRRLRAVLLSLRIFLTSHVSSPCSSHPPIASVRFRQSTKDALEPLRVALESVLTDKNKPYVLLFIVLPAPVLLFTAHRVEQREKQAARIEGTRDKKEK